MQQPVPSLLSIYINDHRSVVGHVDDRFDVIGSEGWIAFRCLKTPTHSLMKSLIQFLPLLRPDSPTL